MSLCLRTRHLSCLYIRTVFVFSSLSKDHPTRCDEAYFSQMTLPDQDGGAPMADDFFASEARVEEQK